LHIDGATCIPCTTLLNHDVIEGIQHQNVHGIANNTPYKWLTMVNIADMLKWKNMQINALKLAGLNMARW
jgi:hypothetical protein